MSSTKCYYGGNRLRLCDNEVGVCEYCDDRSFCFNEKVKYWIYEFNEIMPRQVSKSNEKIKFWFFCPDCGHNYDQFLYQITHNNRGCQYCVSKRLCNDENCDFCKSKTVASTKYAKNWCYNLNKGVTPRDVFLNSKKSYWFKCDVCLHKFKKNMGNAARCFCSYCTKRTTKLCGEPDCDFCFPKSFASHPSASRYSNKNETSIYLIHMHSNSEFLFECDCGLNHEYWQIINGITSSGSSCPYCTNKKLCDNDKCETCREKSFISNPRSASIVNKTINPRMIFKGSRFECEFKCEEGHIFRSAFYMVNRGNWCPLCCRKTEKMVYNFLLDKFPDVIREKHFTWCNFKTKLSYSRYRFDFYIPSKNIIVEIDGLQHFENIKGWNSNHELNRFTDVFKMKLALSKNISIIRILQDDIFRNKYDWETELLNYIVEYKEPCVQYLTTSNIYEKHILDYERYTAEDLYELMCELKNENKNDNISNRDNTRRRKVKFVIRDQIKL